MSGNMATQIDRPYAQQDHVRAAAIRFLERTGNADMLEPLGLAEPEATASTADGRELCANCGKPLPDPVANGGRKPCRRRACVTAVAEDGGRS